jgi:hypothetical protein
MLLTVGAVDESPTTVQAKRVGSTLLLSLPPLDGEEHYTKDPQAIWVKPSGAYADGWLSNGSLKIVSNLTEGSVEIAVCGDGYCRIATINWTAPPPEVDNFNFWFAIFAISFVLIVLIVGLICTVLDGR